MMSYTKVGPAFALSFHAVEKVAQVAIVLLFLIIYILFFQGRRRPDPHPLFWRLSSQERA
jgi:hypothetical protein